MIFKSILILIFIDLVITSTSSSAAINTCVSKILEKNPRQIPNKAVEIARYLCSIDIENEMRETFSEILREWETFSLSNRLPCLKSYLMFLNATGPLVLTFDKSLINLYADDVDGTCRKEIDEIIRKFSIYSEDECQAAKRKFFVASSLKILIIANESHSEDLKKVERNNYLESLRSFRRMTSNCESNF